MSSIPSSKMKHAHAHEGDHPEQSHPPTHQPEAQGETATAEPTQSGSNAAEPTRGGTPSTSDAGYADPEPGAGAKLAQRAKDLGERAKDLGEEAVDAVKARPKTAAAIGAAIVAGAAALVAGPAVARTLRGDDDEPAAKRKPAAKAPAKKSKSRD
jgi:hypothetical protein